MLQIVINHTESQFWRLVESLYGLQTNTSLNRKTRRVKTVCLRSFNSYFQFESFKVATFGNCWQTTKLERQLSNFLFALVIVQHTVFYTASYRSFHQRPAWYA